VGREFEPPAHLDLERCGVEEGYARWADSYDERVTDTLDGPILRELLPRCGLGRSPAVLDLGCGTGRNLAWLRADGLTPQAVGVDPSEAMRTIAQRKGLYRAVMPPDDLAAGPAFDLALCILVGCHVPDLETLYTYAADRLRPGGSFLLIDLHPHMFHLGKGTYVPIGDRRLAIENHVHEVAEYLQRGLAAGFQLVGASESFVPAEWGAGSATYHDAIAHPLGIGFLWHRAPG